MKGKQLLIAALALGVLGGIAYFTSSDAQGSRATEKSGVGKTVVTDLDPAKIATIAITDNDASLTLAQQDEQWIITERDGFAAKFDDIQKLVTSAVSLKSLRQIRASKKQHGRFGLLDPADNETNAGTRVDFKNAQGQVLKSLLLGKKGSANSEANAGSPFGSSDNHRYVLADGKVAVVAIDYSSALNDVSADPADWLNKDDFFKVEKIKSLAVAHPVAADSWTLSRNKEGEDMALAEAKPEEKLDSSKGNTAGRVLGYPSFDDVASFELRGGTHLVLFRKDSITPAASSFDLMVEDIETTHAELRDKGLDPSDIEEGRIHQSFYVKDPAGNTIKFNSK